MAPLAVGLDSDLYAECTFGPRMPEIPLLKKDLWDLTTADLRGFGAVLPLAGLSNDPSGDLNPQVTFDSRSGSRTGSSGRCSTPSVPMRPSRPRASTWS